MKIFLYDIESDYELQDEELSLERAITEFYELSDQEGTFFGINIMNKTIQFAWENDNKWLVDVPVDMEKMLFLQKYANYEECVEIIESIFSGISPKEIDGLVQLNIMTDDLDEILKRNPNFPGLYLNERKGMVYDDYKWHIANDFPKDLPKEAALTHMGMFMGWVLDKGFEGGVLKKHFSGNIEKFRNREVTGAKFLELSSDSRLVSEDLNDEANRFVEFYYASDDYFDDYVDLSDDSSETIFHEPDSWAKYEIVKKMIDEKFEEWTFRN